MSEYICETDLPNNDAYNQFTGEQIVRCRDCKYYKVKTRRRGRKTFEVSLCLDVDRYDESIDYMHVKPDGFCAWGERRDSE